MDETNLIRVVVLRPFSYSENGGITVERMKVGDEPLIDATMFPGLEREKYVKRFIAANVPQPSPGPLDGGPIGPAKSPQSSRQGRLSLRNNSPQSAGDAVQQSSTLASSPLRGPTSSTLPTPNGGRSTPGSFDSQD